MGLGKTLISISVIWAFIKSSKCKSLIVCPSSLCKNWQKEFLKFLGTKCRPLCVQSGDGPDSVKAIINTFSCGHLKGIAPALIISYEVRAIDVGGKLIYFFNCNFLVVINLDVSKVCCSTEHCEGVKFTGM